MDCNHDHLAAILVSGIVFVETHLGVERNPYVKLLQNSSIGYRGDAITEKIQDGQMGRPTAALYVHQILACTTRLLGIIPDKFSKNLTSGLEGDAITRL